MAGNSLCALCRCRPELRVSAPLYLATYWSNFIITWPRVLNHVDRLASRDPRPLGNCRRHRCCRGWCCAAYRPAPAPGGKSSILRPPRPVTEPRHNSALRQVLRLLEQKHTTRPMPSVLFQMETIRDVEDLITITWRSGLKERDERNDRKIWKLGCGRIFPNVSYSTIQRGTFPSACSKVTLTFRL